MSSSLHQLNLAFNPAEDRMLLRIMAGSQILNLQTAGGQGVNLTMNTQLIHSVRKLFADKITEAQWDLPCALYTEEAIYIAEASKSVN